MSFMRVVLLVCIGAAAAAPLSIGGSASMRGWYAGEAPPVLTDDGVVLAVLRHPGEGKHTHDESAKIGEMIGSQRRKSGKEDPGAGVGGDVVQNEVPADVVPVSPKSKEDEGKGVSTEDPPQPAEDGGGRETKPSTDDGVSEEVTQSDGKKPSSENPMQAADEDQGRETKSSTNDTAAVSDGKTPSSEDSTQAVGEGKTDDKKSDTGVEEGAGNVTPPEPADSESEKEDPKAVTEPGVVVGKPPPVSDEPSDVTAPSEPFPTNGTGNGENPDFMADGEAPLDSGIMPAATIGGILAVIALIAAVFVAWSRRSVGQAQVYEPVRRVDDDEADGWNDGWDDGWDEGTATKA